MNPAALRRDHNGAEAGGKVAKSLTAAAAARPPDGGDKRLTTS
jgi:hypothetical protein